MVEAEDLMEKEYFADAALQATKVLDDLEPTVPTIAHAALTKGKALVNNAMKEIRETGELPPRELFEKIWDALTLSKNLDPENGETLEELEKLAHFLRQIPLPEPPKKVSKATVDVLIVGAGASGIGVALMLSETF